MKDLAYYISHPKVDAHNHLNLGMPYTAYSAWSGIKIPNFPRQMAGLDEMHDVISRYTRPSAKSAKEVKELITMSIEAAIEDGVTLIEGSIDIGFMVHFKENYDKFLGMVSDLVNTYKDKITIKAELGMGKTFDKKKIDKWAPVLIKSKVFTSIDLYGPEVSDGIEEFKDIFDLASKEGLRKRAHVGEFSDAASVRHFVEFFDLDEIQHGIGSVQDEKVMQFLADRKVRCNVCPQSNVVLGAVPSLKEHPIKKMMDAGIPIALGTDDLLFFADTISTQLFNLVSQNIITEADAEKILAYH